MSSLESICSSMYSIEADIQAKDLIEECVAHSANNALGENARKGIELACIREESKQEARACAIKWGLRVPEPVYLNVSGGAMDVTVHKPLNIDVGTGTVEERAKQKCHKDFEEGRILLKEQTDCIDAYVTANTPEVTRLFSIRDALALRIGFVPLYYRAQYDNVAREFLGAEEGVSLRLGDRLFAGVHLSLSTGSSYVRFGQTNALYRATFFAIDYFGEDPILFDHGGKGDLFPSQTDKVRNIDNVEGTIGDIDVQIPFFYRNFFLFGATFYQTDKLWGAKTTMPSVFPGAVRFGMNYLLQGAALSVKDDRVSDHAMDHTLRDYSLVGVALELSKKEFRGAPKAAALCDALPGGCNRILNPESSDQTTFAPYFSSEVSREGVEQDNTVLDPYGDVKLTVSALKESISQYGSYGYLGYIHAGYYPEWNKVELGAQADLRLHLGAAMEFYLRLDGRALLALESDQEEYLPDQSFFVGANLGMAWKLMK